MFEIGDMVVSKSCKKAFGTVTHVFPASTDELAQYLVELSCGGTACWLSTSIEAYKEKVEKPVVKPKFKVGDKVMFTNKQEHEDYPNLYPKVGTKGVVLEIRKNKEYDVEWEKGSLNDYDSDIWVASEDSLLLYEVTKELTALEYITEWQRYNKELQRAGQAERLSTILDPEMIDVVAKWAAEHPKPEPISASDYEKLKAIHLLFGDCYVCKDESGFCCAHKEEPSKGGEFWVSADGWVMERFVIDCISWQDNEPLHLTEQWLKEVEHE